VIVIASVVGSTDLFVITVLWSIFLAFRYAKLWADGYDWRDVFSPAARSRLDRRGRRLLTYSRAIMNRDQRKAMREQRRARMGRTGSNRSALPPASGGGGVGGAGNAGDDVVRVAGAYGERIRRAESDRDEILRLLERMPSAERSRIPMLAVRLTSSRKR